ncbi:MAG: folate-binding protein [Pseudomonadota bacterium]
MDDAHPPVTTAVTTVSTAPTRAVIRVTGADRVGFLSNLVSNDLNGPGQGLSYTALLTPQGKYLADFFVLDRGEDLLIDVAQSLAPVLAQRLSMYKLRADVGLEMTELTVSRGLGTAPEGAWVDPRHPELGWRAYGLEAAQEPGIDWDAIRVAHCVPETGIELISGEGYILEAGFERLNGVNHRKGCYVGQEVTARMKHKTELRKGLVTVEIEGEAAQGTQITAEGRAVGTLYTQAGGRAIAHLRFDKARDRELSAGAATLRWNGTLPG